MQCIVGWTNRSLSSSASLTLLFLSFTIAPSAWQRPYDKCNRFTANHLGATSSRHDNYFLSNSHLLLALSTDAKYGHLVISLPLLTPPTPPVFVTSSFPPCSLCLMYMCAQLCSLQVKRGSACEIRPVWCPRDKQRNCFLNQEVECCKCCSLGGSKRQLAGCHHTHPMAGTPSQGFTYPLSSSSARLMRA